jgi:hypothetical protein
MWLRGLVVAPLSVVESGYREGSVTGVSESVLDGIAHALQLTGDERTHLFDLVQTASSSRPGAAAEPRPVPVPEPARRGLLARLGPGRDGSFITGADLLIDVGVIASIAAGRFQVQVG